MIVLTDKEKEAVLFTFTNKIIENSKKKKYKYFKDLDEEDLIFMSLIKKINPDKYSWSKCKIEDFITGGD